MMAKSQRCQFQLPAGLVKRVKDTAKRRTKKEGRVCPSQIVKDALEAYFARGRKVKVVDQ